MTACPTRPPADRTTHAELAADIRRRHRGLLKDLVIVVHDGRAELHGRATTFYGKQVALHEVLRLGGLRVVANRIVVEN